jgi:putative cell wall-binding protein
MNMKKIACLISLSICLSFCLGTKAKAAFTPERIFGADRYETSVAISQNGWNAVSDYAVIASGEDFGDALSAAPLAKKYNAPILLVSKDKLDNQSDANNISSELLRLKVKKVFLIGGNGSISENVEKVIKSKGIEIDRISGKNRYATSIEIAKRVGIDNGIVLTTGQDFADALSVAPIAASKGMPIIIVPKDQLTAEIKDYVDSNNISKTYIMGGNDIISDEVSKEFKNVERIEGADEYQRNLGVLDKFAKDIHYDTVYLASRDGFADALSGSVLASLTSSPIILVNEKSQTEFQEYIKDKIKNIGQVNVLGGEGVIKTSLLENIIPVAKNQGINSGLLKASFNQQNITSMQSDNTIAINANAKNLAKEQQEVADTVVPVINNSKITFNIKANGNNDKTIGSVQEDIVMQVGGMNIETTAWVTTDLSSGQPKINEIVKIPKVAALYLPSQFAEKQYMVMDPIAMNSELTPGVADFNGLMNFSKNFQPQFQSFMEKYAERWNPGVKFITYKGLIRINTKEGIKYAQTYELKLDDVTLKTILNYTANDFVLNRDSMNFVKQFIISCIDLSVVPDKDIEKQQIEKAFSDLDANPEEAVKQIRVFMDAIKDFKIIGDKGIDITYNICDGYIVGENGIVDLQLDIHKFVDTMNKLSNTPEDKTTETVKGMLGLGYTFTTENYNINKDVKIESPELTKENSFDYMELIKLEQDSQQSEQVKQN